MSTLATTLSQTDASQTEILARHLFDEECTAENADLDLEQYIQKFDGLHEGDGCLFNPANDREHAQYFDWLRLAIAWNAVTASYQPGLSRAEWQSLARVPYDRTVGNDNECPDGKVSTEPIR